MPVKIENRIGVQRSVEQVWAAIYDLDTWAAWNPMYPAAQGRLLISAPLTLTEKVGDRSETYQAVVGDWVPASQIIWLHKTHAGLVRHVRFFELEKLTEQACIFANGVLLDGLGADLLTSKRRRGALRRAFVGMGEAVKARTEAGHGDDVDAWRR